MGVPSAERSRPARMCAALWVGPPHGRALGFRSAPARAGRFGPQRILLRPPICAFALQTETLTRTTGSGSRSGHPRVDTPGSEHLKFDIPGAGSGHLGLVDRATANIRARADRSGGMRRFATQIRRTASRSGGRGVQDLDTTARILVPRWWHPRRNNHRRRSEDTCGIGDELGLPAHRPIVAQVAAAQETVGFRWHFPPARARTPPQA
mmetsp:Transcript_45718/g.76179  ORF Transcript_45718/g.76179 Transcript_45718/m.76179 type:complete len:208 (+) Transcript_45718:121-744(+)